MGRYSAIASLGQGGMANIYLALLAGPARFNKLLVLKVLREDLETSREDLATMFLDEARLAARLQHRNIVQTYEFGEHQGRYYMAMEYLEGRPLRALQRKLAPLPFHEELRVLAETARGAHYAHDLTDLHGEPLEVVHRDISPQNVFVTYAGEVKLLDFGIAKMVGAEHLTQAGVIKGKIDYIAPEQVRGEKVDRRADVFSLGAMLWEAITGERFGGGPKVPDVTKFHKRLTGGEPDVRELRPDVPEALASIVNEAIALDPKSRMPTAAAFATRLEAYLNTLEEPPSDKSLAALLVAPFEEERTELRGTIERQCKRLLESGDARTGLDLALVQAGGPDLSPATGSSAFDASIGPQSSSLSGQRKVSAWRGRGLVAGLGLALAIAILLLLQQQVPPQATAPPPPQATVAPVPRVSEPSRASEDPTPPPAKTPTANTIKLVLEASPPGASALLDGVRLSSLPFTGQFQKSGALHRLEVDADGYQPVRKFVTFDKDQNLKIELRPVAQRERQRPRAPRSARAPQAPAPSQPAEVAVQPPAPAPRPVAPAPGTNLRVGQGRRGFDMRDPYAD